MTDTISTSIRLTPDLRRRIKQASHRCEMTQTLFIALALGRAVEEAEPQLSYHALQCEIQNEQGFPEKGEMI